MEVALTLYLATTLTWLPDKLDILDGAALGAGLGAALAGSIALITRANVEKVGQFTAVGTIAGYFVAAIAIAVLATLGRPHGLIK